MRFAHRRRPIRASVHCAHRTACVSCTTCVFLVYAHDTPPEFIVRAHLRDAAEVGDSAFNSRMSLERV